VFAAAALRVNGYPPLLLDLEASTTPTSNRRVPRGRPLGAVAKSNYTGCDIASRFIARCAN